jgi:hypothetical protein
MEKATQHSEVVKQLTDFFIVFTLQILYYLVLYPPESFKEAKAYHSKVLQSRHDGVSDYVISATNAIHEELMNTKS